MTQLYTSTMYLPALLALCGVCLAAPKPKPQNEPLLSFPEGESVTWLISNHPGATSTNYATYPAPSAPDDIPRPFTLSIVSTPSTTTTKVEEPGVPSEGPWVYGPRPTESLSIYKPSSTPAIVATEVEDPGMPSEGPWIYGEGPQYEPGRPIVTVVDGATVTWYPAPEVTTRTRLDPPAGKSLTLTSTGFTTIPITTVTETQVSAVGHPLSARAPQYDDQPIVTVVDGATVTWYPVGYTFPDEATPTEAVVTVIEPSTSTIYVQPGEPTETPADEGNSTGSSYEDTKTTGPGYCGLLTFEDQTSSASPYNEDCLQIVRNMAGHGRWDIDMFLHLQKRIVNYGSCALGVQGIPRSTWEIKAYINWEDITDIIMISIEKFGQNGQTGAKGIMECLDSRGRLRYVDWGLY